MYQQRTYRTFCDNELKSKQVIIDESDLMIYYSHSVDGITDHLSNIRQTLEDQIKIETSFLTSLEPLKRNKNDPAIVKHMKLATQKCSVGPMASVAGAVSEYLAHKFIDQNTDFIVENGGDLFIKSSLDRNILIHAGDSPLSDQISIKITPEMSPIGICTSSGKLGHSLSFGQADAVVILSKDTLLADAAATAIGNIIKKPEDIEKGIEMAKTIEEIEGILIIVDSSIGMWGNITLI